MSKMMFYESWSYKLPKEAMEFEDALPDGFKLDPADITEVTGADFCACIHKTRDGLNLTGKPGDGFVSPLNTGRHGTVRVRPHWPTVDAVLNVLREMARPVDEEKDDLPAFGVQEAEGFVQYYCVEQNRGDWCRVYGIYNPGTGELKFGMDDSGSYKKYPPVREPRGSSVPGNYGIEALEALFLALLDRDPWTQEKVEQFKHSPDEDIVIALTDHMFHSVGTPSLPVSSAYDATGNLGSITKMKAREYAPTSIWPGGPFRILCDDHTASVSGAVTMESLRKAYGLGAAVAEDDRCLIPRMPESYRPSVNLTKMAKSAKKLGFRKFMLYGPAGTGKSTDAKALADALGLPYFYFTCSENTDEMDLVAAMVPDAGNAEEVSLPDYTDFIMYPAGEAEKYTGELKEDMEEAEAFRVITQALAGSGGSSSGFKMVESSIIRGCRRPSVIEIQEVNRPAKPACLTKLNNMLDDGMSIQLLDGTQVSVDPDTVFVLTTNVGYAGCRKLDESIWSRMNLKIRVDGLSAEEMTDRVMKRLKIDPSEREEVSKMAETIVKVQGYLRDQMITGGVCNYREFENWVAYSAIASSPLEGFRDTVLSAITQDEELAGDIMSFMENYYGD